MGVVLEAAEELVRQIKGLETEIKEQAAKIEEQAAKIEELEADLADSIDETDRLRRNDYEGLETKVGDILDLVERPVGKLTPHLPPSAASERALLALGRAIGRL